jgi:hypothetical protein
VQIVIALVVTPEGLPLAYEVLPDQHRTARRFEVPHLAARCGVSAARPAEPINQQRMCLVVS